MKALHNCPRPADSFPMPLTVNTSRPGFHEASCHTCRVIISHLLRTHGFGNYHESGTKPDRKVSIIDGLGPQNTQILGVENGTYAISSRAKQQVKWHRNKVLKKKEKEKNGGGNRLILFAKQVPDPCCSKCDWQTSGHCLWALPAGLLPAESQAPSQTCWSAICTLIRPWATDSRAY